METTTIYGRTFKHIGPIELKLHKVHHWDKSQENTNLQKLLGADSQDGQHEHICLAVLVWRPPKRYPVSILRKSISGRHRPVRVADGPMTARCRFT